MPFNSWYLKPAALNECIIGITGALLKIEINIKVRHIKFSQEGDSGENRPVCPIRNVLKNFISFQSEWDCC